MKTIKSTKTWILICSILVVSSALEHASSLHDVVQHEDSAKWKKLKNTIIPYGVQMPDHVLSAQNLSCISADNNIFEIMNKAQETCNGSDMRCTFYHFLNHGYENIGTLNINKERFDELLTKFDNWLLTAENIEKSGDGKTKEDSSLETASIGVNDGLNNENSSISTEIKGLDASQDGHIDKSDDDRVHSHHLKTPHEIHHKIHHGKDHNSVTAPNIYGKQWKNENHIKLNPEYNAEHRYFEVYIPKDKVTGKPRTIYVEIDQDKNEFILLDEEIDKKLKGIKPIRIELDELSGIADTAFNKVSKTSNFKEHVHNHLTDDEKAIISDISKHSAVNVDAVHVYKDVGEQTQSSINASVSHPYIYKIEAEEQHKLDVMTGNVKEIINDNKNLMVPNKYINQAQFNIESHIDNSTDDMQNDYFELLESNNTETDTHTDFYEKEETLDTIEYNDNNTYGLNGTENSSLDYSDIAYENDNDTSTNYYELPTEHKNVTLHDDSFIQVEKHNDTYHDIDYDDSHDFSSSNTLNLNEFTVQVENPVQVNNLKSTAELSEYTDSELHAIPLENRHQGYTDLHDLSLEPSLPLKPYTSVPILGKDSSNILKTDSYLTSSPPAHATLNLHAGDSQNTPLNPVVEHPSITSYISPLDSVCAQSGAPKISQYSPSIFASPPVECFVRHNKDSPLNFGVSGLPSYARIEDLQLPCEIKPLSLDHVFSPHDSISPLTVPSMEYIGSSQSSPHTTPVKHTTLIQSIPSSSYVIQEPSLITTPCNLETTAPMTPKYALLSKLGLPESNIDYERIPTPYSSSVKHINILSPTDSGLIKKTPSETMIPCSANSKRIPYTTIPYFSNPYLKSPQFIPSYLEPLLQTPLQPALKIPTLDSVPISLDQSNPCLTGVNQQEKKAMQFRPFAPNSQFSPLNPMLVGTDFPPNALPCPNIWNNIPYLSYTDQNIRNNPPFLSNYVTPTTDQNHKPLLSKTVPLSIVEHPCSSNNIFELTPSSYTPFLPVHTSQVQQDLNPSLALERDLERLSLKYGIPLSKILHSIETEISDSKTCSPTLEVLNNNLKYDGSLTAQQSHTLLETNANVYNKYRSGDEELLHSDLTNLTPLDSSLIGPHLELENSLNVHDSQSYTILPETTEPVTTPHLNAKTLQTNTAIKDSSLIGPQLSTLSSSNILLSDDNRSVYELVLSESDSSNLMSLDASLTGPHLKIGNPPTVLDSHIKPLLSNEIQNINEILPLETDLTDLTPVDISQVDLKNELVLSTTSAKPLLINEIQTINEMIPLESDLTDLTPFDMPEVDFVNEQSDILQHAKSTVTLSSNSMLHKTAEYLPTKLEGEELLLKSDSSSLIPLDFSLIGPDLNLESLQVITDIIGEKLAPTVSQDNLQKTDIEHDELESITLPSSLLPTLLNEPVKADSNLNIISQDTILNEEIFEISNDANVTPLKETDFKIVEPIKLDLNLNVNTQNTQLNQKLSLDNCVEIPLADTSQIFLKETDFKIIEEIPELHDSNIIPLLPKDTTTLKDKLTSPVMSLVDYEPQLESSLIGASMLPKIQRPIISSTSDSLIQLDNYLVGPSILNEIDTQSPVMETVDQLESLIVGKSIDQNIKPLESRIIDSNIQFDSSLFGPTIYKSLVPPSLYKAGTKISTALDASHLDTSLITPSLYETVEASASSSASSQLDSSLLGTSLKPDMESLDVSSVFDFKKLDSTLVGPHLSTASFSSDEIQMINNELHQKSELANLIPLDSTLIGPHAYFESQLDRSETSRYQNPELSLTSNIACIDFLNSDFVKRHPPKSNTASSINQFNLQELLSKFKNSITKSQLLPSEFKPCELLSPIQSTDTINLSPTCSDLQPLTWNTLLNTPLSLLDDTASAFSPLTITEKNYSPVGSVVKRPCINLNDFSLAESLPYAQGVPQIPFTPNSPFIQMRPLVNHNWIPQPLNILQAAPGITPVVGNAPVPFISNELMPLAPEDLKLLLDLASQSKTFPQLSMPNIFTPMKAVPPSLEWTTLSNNLPVGKYVPLLPKKNYFILPSNLESSVSNSEYTPIEVNDIMSLLDENSYKLLQDMSILPFSQSSLTPSIPVFETGEFVSPSLSDVLPILNSDFIKTRPVLPLSISNAMVPSSIYTHPQIGLNNPQNIPYKLPTPNIPPCSLQPYSITPLDVPFSEIIGPAPIIESLPTESSKSSLESQWHEIPNTAQLMESIPNFTLDREFSQQLLSKPCLESPIILPSSLLDTMLQGSTTSNKLKSYPCQSPPEFITPVSPALTTQLSNAYTSPVLPIYASPLSVSYAKPILSKSTNLPLNVPYEPSSLTLLPISPYTHTASSVIPDFSSPLRPLKSTPLSNYELASTETYNRPKPSRIPYEPSQMYSSPYLSEKPSPLPDENSPYSPTFMSKLRPSEISPISPVFYEPLTTPYFTPEHKPKSLTNFETSTYSGALTPVTPISMASSPPGALPPSYISPDLSIYEYLPIPAPVNTLTQPSSTFSPAYITPLSPVSSTLPSYSRPLSSKPMFNLKLEPTPQELENLRLLNTSPVSNADKPFLNANQMLLTSSNILPLQNYHEYVPTSSPFYSSQIKQIKPSEYEIGPNLQTTSLTEETTYEIIEENIYANSNEKDIKYYEDYNFKHPLESLSYSLAPEDIKETEKRPKEEEDFIKQEDLTLSAPNLAFEPSLQSKLYQRPLLTAKSLKKPLITPQYISSILPAQTELQETCPLNEAPLNYQPYIPLPTVPSNAAKNIFKSPLVTLPYTEIPSDKNFEPMSPNLNSPQWSSLSSQYSLPVSSSPISKSSPVTSLSNVKYSIITPDVDKQPMTNHIKPSSLFMSSDTDFQRIPLNKSTPLQSLPRYSYSSPTLTEPVEIVPYEIPKKPLGQTILPQNIFKPNTQYNNGKYIAVPMSSSPYLTQPLEIIDQPLPNVQYTNKLHPKSSPILAQFASPSLATSFTSLPLETVPNSGINKSLVPQYSLASVPTYDTPIQSPALARNPFLNQDFKLITKVPAYPVPNNQISPLKLTPYESILLSNLKPLGISQEALESSPMTSSTPLSLLKPLTKILTQKSRHYQPQMIPIDSQYVSQPQIDSVPQLLSSASPILKNPLLKPLLTNILNYSPSLPNYVSSSNIAISESTPMQYLPFVSSNQKNSSPSESLVSELPETLELMNQVPVTPYSLLKPSFYKKYQSPITITNIPMYSNYDVLESSPYLPIKGNYMNTVKPIEISPISATESSRLSLDYDTDIIEKIVPYELRPDLKDKFSYLPLNLNQQRQFYPALPYLTLSQPTHITSASSKYKTVRPRPFSISSVIPEDVELIDTTDFIPISPIQSKASTSSYSPVDRKAPIPNTPTNIAESNTLLSSPYTILSNSDFSPSTFKSPPKSITNTQSIQESDISQFFPYNILSNSDFSPPTSNKLPPTLQKQCGNQRPQSSPIYLSPQEYEELTKGLSSSQTSSSSITLPYTNIDSELITNLLTARPIPLTPLYASPISKLPENLLQFSLFGKYSPLQETPEIEYLNKYRPAHKTIPLGVNNYHYEPKPSIVELLSDRNSIKSVNPLIKSKESYKEYIEDIKSNDENDYVMSEYVSLDQNESDVFEAKPFTNSLAEIIKDVNVPNYYNDNNLQRPQILSKLDNFYANNHIGQGPQVFTAPTFNTSPISSSTDGERSYTTIPKEIYKDFTVIPVKHLGSPKLDKSSRLTEYYPEITNFLETVSSSSYTQNYINPSLKSYSQIKPTNAIEVTDTSEIPSSSYNLSNNINDIKYSGYKTYQLPSLKFPKTTQNLGTPQMYSPSLVPYAPLNPSKPPNFHQIPSPPEFYELTEIYEPITPQYQAPQKITSPLQTKLSLDTLQESPEYNDYDTIEDEPVGVDDIKEDNELKTSLIKYINKRNDIKNNLDNNNQEFTIPVGNIAITTREPYNADTIETNNPSIGLKVWKSNIKTAQAELKLKLKDLSVINFMPVVNNLDKYDTEEIRKIVKNYIDEKYGNHVEITKPYTVDNQYTIIKYFDPNAVSNKYNLLWPTHYV